VDCVPRRFVLALLCLPLLISACGAPSDEVSNEAAATTTTAAAPVPETTTTAAPSTTSPSSPESQAAAAPPERGIVPNVVGLDHQLGQDTMQGAGFYYLREEDASGQERLLVNDRNWYVCSQSPPGGTEASTDDQVVLSSVKKGEACP